MPDNGSGNYSPPPASFPEVPDTLIDANRYDAVITDVGVAMSNRICRDGQSTLLNHLPFNGFKATGMAQGTARTDSATLSNIQDGTGVYVSAVGGTADTITLSPSPGIAVYTPGQHFLFVALGTNTSTVTVAVSGLAAKAILKNALAPLVAGDITANAVLEIFYDGTRFLLTTTNSATLTSPTINTPTINTPTINTAALVSPTLSGTPVFPDNVFTVGGSSDASKKLAFEVDGLTTAVTRTLTVQDEDGTLALTSEFTYSNLAGSLGRMPFHPKFIQGFTYITNAGDATNDLDIAAGSCRDATDAHNLIVDALTKQSDATWVVGTNQGALDTGAVGNSDYYIWAIKRSDTGVCDILFSLSSTAPNMPASYDFKRLIGWFKRVAGAIVPFNTYELEGGGLHFAWSSPTLDINLSNTLTTARRTDAVKVPLDFSVRAHLNVNIGDAGSAAEHYITCPDAADIAPSSSVAPLATAQTITTFSFLQPIEVRTSVTGTIAARSTIATVDSYRVATLGFKWTRRN
jgi:hypothetical protein